MKGRRWEIDGFSNLVDQCRRSVSNEFGALANVHDSYGFEFHQSCAQCA